MAERSLWDDPEPPTVTARMAAYFRARPGQWIDARELVKVGGYGGWRTRVSQLRRPPWSMAIGPPRYVPLMLSNGKRVRISEYRLER